MAEEVKVETVETQKPQVEEVQETETVKEGTTETSTETKKPNPTEVLRELSKQFSVNLFDEGGLEALNGKLAERETLFKEKEIKLEEELKKSFTQKEEEYKVQIEALGMGFTRENLDEVLALAKVNAKDQPITEGLKVVKEKYGSVFTVQGDIGVQFGDLKGDKPDVPRTEQEKYLANNPTYQAYLKQQQKLKKN